MRLCCVCKLEKNETEFNKKRARKDGLQPHCRECSHKKFAAYYINNRQKHLKNVRRNKKRVIGSHKLEILEYLKEHPCVDCGEKDPVVLEFDHVRGKKVNSVTRMVARGLSREQVSKEIAKCEIRCANCHRRRTYKVANSYRTQSSTG